MWERNCFITLTYDEASCPVSLDYSHFQKFMKDLRGREGPGIRFFMCGEYGELKRRPHFHACLFNYDFPDKQVFKHLAQGRVLYRSGLLERLWPRGFASIGEVTFESAAYVARYVLKKITGDSAAVHYRAVDSVTGEIVELVPEFCHMSLKPGIGFHWLRLYASDISADGKIVVNGFEAEAPKYYKRYFSRTDAVADWDYQRQQLVVPGEKSPERLAVKEKVFSARVSSLKRSL